MAFMRIEIKNHTRGIVSRLAYRNGERMWDEYNRRTFDYRNKEHIIYAKTIFPSQIPDWLNTPEKFWNEAEKAERRYDARVAKEFVISLPRELSDESNIEVIKRFVDSEFTSKKLVASIAIHNPPGSDGKPNPHAHVLVCMRPIEGEKFSGTKSRFFDNKRGIQHIRSAWKASLNKALGLENDRSNKASQNINTPKVQNNAPKLSQLDLLNKATTRVKKKNIALKSAHMLKGLNNAVKKAVEPEQEKKELKLEHEIELKLEM